ncbi:nucleotide sugar dehydrogenase [Oceanirhabdus sp. W0125-5]|uniref:nucleotide sugar dehydrogenase n=1 Tax=Oceanirhabdus sp. W0125-5 TaxID=2999116 RepID=UPI0022F33ED3|nr:nucleotide sugar dehydrogenase [Oceanirhabdus sp. W0125-5]WBW96619.1 nucleotide sugar dehydrogenase [Oceanirhabdus sp. W0125-5]
MTVYVFGLGHIGLPMACWIASANTPVYGIDINDQAIKNIKQGKVNIEEYRNEIHISQVAKNLISKNLLNVTSKFKRVDDTPSIFVISVGIANREDGSQDVSPIESVLDTITPTLVDGDLLIFRTTLIPGTCDNLILPKLKSLDVSVSLAYCPETLMETKAFEELENNPMILAGMDDNSFNKAKNFISSLTDAPIYKASNIRTAEMTKVIQNINRDVNIALVNEISEATALLDIDIYELQTLVNTHPRVTLLTPGPGVGGYCLPNAFEYLDKAILYKEKCPLTLIRTARQLNIERPKKIVELIKTALNNEEKNIKESTIALIGLAMKDFCADCRFSPALDIASLLIEEGANVQAYDPMVPLNYNYQVATLEECVKNTDCIVITANQEGVISQLNQLHRDNKLPLIVIDTRNIFPSFPDIKLYKL